MKRLLSLPVLLAASTACSSMPPNPKPSNPYPPRLARCQAEPAQRFLGLVASDEVVEQARVATGANTVRVLKQGMAATLEYRDDRLDLQLDDHDVIVKASCG